MEKIDETCVKKVAIRSIAGNWQVWFRSQWEKCRSLFVGKSNRREPVASVNVSVKLVSKIQQFMEQEYELRYNELRGEAEFRPRNQGCPNYMPVTERDMNTIVLRAQETGLPVWDRDIKRFVNSDRVPLFNPADDYLSHRRPLHASDACSTGIRS